MANHTKLHVGDVVNCWYFNYGIEGVVKLPHSCNGFIISRGTVMHTGSHQSRVEITEVYPRPDGYIYEPSRIGSKVLINNAHLWSVSPLELLAMEAE